MNNSIRKSATNHPSFFTFKTAAFALLFCFFGLSQMSFRTTAEAHESTKMLGGCPIAEFTTAATICSQTCTVSFVNQSVNATSYFWEFGDGTTSIEKNPKHEYLSNGTYSVRLTAIGVTCSTEFIGIVEVIGG